jgi:hypothetical protein
MPNDWPYDWESMATKERESLETRVVGGLLVLYLCVSLLSDGSQKTVPLPVRG